MDAIDSVRRLGARLPGAQGLVKRLDGRQGDQVADLRRRLLSVLSAAVTELARLRDAVDVCVGCRGPNDHHPSVCRAALR